uniref:SWIM-type domain-containing protein n=1 Tax=Fagus sylvatica TaxID=28930 RepID=A0A2N9HH41_FAGSY
MIMMLMDMVKYVKGYNEVDVYVMSLADYEVDGGNEENGDNEGDEVEGDDHEEDSACKVHFGGSESDNNDMFDIDEVASKQVKPSAKVNLQSRGLVDSSSDDEATPRYPQYRPPESFSEVKFEIEMQFATKNDVMDAIKHYSIFKSVPLKFKKNDRVRVRVKCKDGCPFELYCGKMKNEDTWQVKTLRDEHNCGKRLKNRFASSNWLGKHLVDQVRSDPKMKTALIKTEVASMFKVHISRHQASRAKSNAKELVQGTFKEQYAQLGDYCEELMRSNPYSTAILSTNRPQPHLQPLFERFYVCLDACKRGFLDGCRPFIGVDGCHLKGQYPGQLLTAVGKDGNNGVYPIAFAVVEAETKDSWTWFMTNLLKDGLVETFKTLMPEMDHRHCVRHLYNNFSKEHKGKLLKDCMWAAARATNMAEFKIEMEKIKKLNIKAWEWLEAVEKELWTRAKFRTNSKCDALTNNGIQNKLEVEKSNSREWVPTCCGDKSLSKFEVTYKGNICGKQYIVDIEHKTCSCGAWDLSGIPCAHSIAALASDDHNIEDYVHTCYSAVSFAQAYGPCVYPINGPDLWPRNDREIPLPPPWRRQAGRPKKKRRREHGELKNPYKMQRKNGPVRCSSCGVIGHNKRRCKDATDEANKATTQANKTKRVRRKNTTATGVLSSSQIEPTNGVASLSQETPPAPLSQSSSQVAPPAPPSQSCGQVELTHAVQLRQKIPLSRRSNFGVSTETMAAASEASRRITKLYMNTQAHK